MDEPLIFIKPTTKQKPFVPNEPKRNWLAPTPWHVKFWRKLKSIIPKKKYLTIEEFDKQENIKDANGKN